MERDWWNLKTTLVRQTLMQNLQYKLVPILGTSHVTISAVFPKHGFVMGMMTALTTRMKNRTALVSNIKTFIFQSLLFDSM
jgi:hypothetical protein